MDPSCKPGVVKVHGIPPWSPTMRVLIALAEKGVEFELVPVDLAAREHKQPKHTALQPFGRIPVYQDENVTLFESRAIMRYIADKFKDQGASLYGSTPEERALVDQWVESESQNYTPAAQPAHFQLVLAPLFLGSPTDHSILQANMAKLESVLDIYERHLSAQPYFAGDSFTLADLTHMPLAYHLIAETEQGKAVFTGRPHVKAWWDRVSSRPAWKKMEMTMPLSFTENGTACAMSRFTTPFKWQP